MVCRCRAARKIEVFDPLSRVWDASHGASPIRQNGPKHARSFFEDWNETVSVDAAPATPHVTFDTLAKSNGSSVHRPELHASMQRA